jgi:hypothetical protein
MLIQDRIRTSHNLFKHDWVEVKLGGASHWVQAAALRNYCGIYREQEDARLDDIVHLDCKDISKKLARVFLQAISPFPRGSLPTHDHIQDPEKDLGSRDVANVMCRDDSETRQIDWTMMCIDMYKLASAMQCPVVKDMVVDKIREIYLTHCEEQTEQDFDSPLDFASSLSSDEDAPILRLLSDILNDGSRKGQDHTHDEHLADHIVRLMTGRYQGWGGSMSLHAHTPTQYCLDYHSHGYERRCHKELDGHHDIKDMIADIFSQIKPNTLNYIEELRADDHKPGPYGFAKAFVFTTKFSRLLRGSRRREEEVALLMAEYEHIARKINKYEDVPESLEEEARRIAEQMTQLRGSDHYRWLQNERRAKKARLCGLEL